MNDVRNTIAEVQNSMKTAINALAQRQDSVVASSTNQQQSRQVDQQTLAYTDLEDFQHRRVQIVTSAKTRLDAAVASRCPDPRGEAKELLQAYNEYLGVQLKDVHDRLEYYNEPLVQLRRLMLAEPAGPEPPGEDTSAIVHNTILAMVARELRKVYEVEIASASARHKFLNLYHGTNGPPTEAQREAPRREQSDLPPISEE